MSFQDAFKMFRKFSGFMNTVIFALPYVSRLLAKINAAEKAVKKITSDLKEIFLLRAVKEENIALQYEHIKTQPIVVESSTASKLRLNRRLYH